MSPKSRLPLIVCLKRRGFLDLKLQVSRELLNAFQADFHNRIEEEEKDRGRS